MGGFVPSPYFIESLSKQVLYKCLIGGYMKPAQIQWTPWQIDLLKKLISEHSVEETAVMMGTTAQIINAACSRFKISRAKARLKWSEEEDQFVIRNAGFMSIQRMADMLGRSYAAVQNRACMHLNISLKLK
nr:MAG TPA: Transcription factor WER/DNA Complex factor, DNA BINDING PROTEIN-DNA.15A [Caudoviricetes sp.]